MNPHPRVTEAVARLRGVFLETPSTELSLADAVRLSGVERPTCQIILEALEDARFLARDERGLFIRRPSTPPRKGQ